MEVIDEEWEATKRRIKTTVKDAKFNKDVVERYVEALTIWLDYEKYKKLSQWDNGFYCLHLYLECTLGMGLHLPSNHPKFHKQAIDVRDTLSGVPDEMDLCMAGIRLQIVEKYRRLEKPKPEFVNTEEEQREDTEKRYSREEISNALDALRLDGKKTNVKMYGMHIEDISSAPRVAPAATPPSYSQVSKQFRIKKVTGDGSCAFRSIAQGQNGGALSFADETALASELRRIVCVELRSRGSEEMTGTGLTLEQLVLMKDAKYPTFSEYIQAMSRSDYAGETEFLLLSNKLGITISVFHHTGSFEHLITYGDEKHPSPIRLLWQRGLSEAGNHYDALI